MVTSSLTAIDRLRLDAAIKATELAMSKWERVAFGVEKTKDPALLSLSRLVWQELHMALLRVQHNART